MLLFMLEAGGNSLAELQKAIRKFQGREDRRVDPKGLRQCIDALEGEAAAETRAAQVAGDHLANGNATVVTWLSRLCGMSATSAADRLCVGTELESLPKIAAALRTGVISYQSTSLLCHLRDQLGKKRELFVEDEMLEHARNLSVGQLRYLCHYARHVADPDGFFNEAEADFTRRRLDISQMGDGMFCVDAILDPVAGAAFKAALESLAKRLGPDDERSHKQRMADSVGELVHHAGDQSRTRVSVRAARSRGLSPSAGSWVALGGLTHPPWAWPSSRSYIEGRGGLPSPSVRTDSRQGRVGTACNLFADPKPTLKRWT